MIMKKENEKLEARVEALENRVRTLEAMFNSLSAVNACAAFCCCADVMALTISRCGLVGIGYFPMSYAGESSAWFL